MGPKKSSAITLHNVAEKAGTSVATVSRVLSGADYPVSQKLRQKILRAAKELNYMPNNLGKMLKNNSSPAIGIIVPTLQNPFFVQVITGVESAARQKNFEVMIFSSHRSIQQERDSILNLLQNRIMRMIIISIDSKPDTISKYIEHNGRAAILESNFQIENAICSETDYNAAGKLAAEYLLSAGHKKIAFLSAPITKSYRRRILEGLQAAFSAAGAAFSEDDIFVSDIESEAEIGQYEFELGKQLAVEFLHSNQKYTAIIAINDITAFGVIQELTQRGIHVPQDVSVISFDNISYSNMISPPLTTVELPSETMGYTACQLIMSESIASTGAAFSFHCSLKERSSVRNLNKES